MGYGHGNEIVHYYSESYEGPTQLTLTTLYYN
jgi:hypothetical protein